MNHKPMLAVDCGGLGKVRFPVIASPKLDGVRCIITAAGAMSRSLKPLPNVWVQEALSHLPVGLDGELIVGPVTAKDAYRKTVSVVMSDDKSIDGLCYWVFDIQGGPNMDDIGDLDTFEIRSDHIRAKFKEHTESRIQLVPQVKVATLEQLTDVEHIWVAAGHEGVILRKPGSPYKHGRSTVKEGYLLKLKRFQDGEAEVIGLTELMHNGNGAITNELGRTARSHKKAGLVGAGVMGTLQVRDVVTGVEFEIGTGFTAEERKTIWAHYEENPNVWSWNLVKYKHFPVGAKDKPRHPVFLGWRDKRDC
jgi:DNA ligase-1